MTTEPQPCISVHVTLPPDLVSAIDIKAGKRGRSEFLRRAAAKELQSPDLAETLPQGRRRSNG